MLRFIYNNEIRYFGIGTPISSKYKSVVDHRNKKNKFTIVYKDSLTRKGKRKNITAKSSLEALNIFRHQSHKNKYINGKGISLPSMAKAYLSPSQERDANYYLKTLNK